MDTLNQIESYGIETRSHISAVSDIRREGDLTELQYRNRLMEITKVGTTEVPIEMLPLVYGYTIQEAIREKLNGKELFEFAKNAAYAFYNANTFILAKPQEEVKLDERGIVKKKKGEKGDLAREAYLANRNNDLTRQEMLAIIVSSADMSSAGASTYYAKFKKEYDA